MPIAYIVIYYPTTNTNMKFTSEYLPNVDE